MSEPMRNFIEGCLASHDDTFIPAPSLGFLLTNGCSSAIIHHSGEKGMEKKIRDLGSDSIGKLLFSFAVPAVSSLLISSLYNLVDQIFIGNSRLGYLGNAATGLAFPIIVIAQAFAWWFSDGCASYLSICQGKKDTTKAAKAIGTSLTLIFVVSGILMTVCLSFAEPILGLFGGTENTLPLAVSYLKILAWFFPLFLFQNAINGVIRCDGSPLYSMIAVGSGAVVNIILDPVFIYVLDAGIEGAAWATVIGQVVAFFVSLAYLFFSKTFRLKAKDFIPDFSAFKEPLILGLSTLITQFAVVAISLSSNASLAKWGPSSPYGADIPISVMSIQTKVFSFVVNIAIGIVLGGTPIVGYNIGAKNEKRVKKTYMLTLIWSMAFSMLFFLVDEIYPDAFILPFGDGGEQSALYMEYARKLFRLMLGSIPLTVFIKMTSLFFQSAGKPFLAILSSLSRDILVFVPCVIALPYLGEAISPGSGVNALLFSSLAADAVGFSITLPLTVAYFKKLPEELKKEPEEV
ncbi:MAG TPA: MATE family efflux transporter [Firmicutes bacterium]|nr:MATE family efflux transporter [Bacillota bacterium]